jgi:hypothetical protein
LSFPFPGRPKRSSNTDLEHGATSLGNFCKMVSDLVPNASGRKDVLADIARGAVEPVIESLSERVAALYNNHRIDDAPTLETITTQLEAAKWPNFAEAKAAK